MVINRHQGIGDTPVTTLPTVNLAYLIGGGSPVANYDPTAGAPIGVNYDPYSLDLSAASSAVNQMAAQQIASEIAAGNPPPAASFRITPTEVVIAIAAFAVLYLFTGRR